MGGLTLRRSEWALAAYFLYAAVVAQVLPIQRDLALLTLGLNASIIASYVLLAHVDSLRRRRFFSIVRDWYPTPLLVLAYREMGWFAPSHHSFELEKFGERGSSKVDRGGMTSHHRPFLSCGFLDVAADEGAQSRFRFAGKSTGKDYDGSERARFTIDRGIRPFVVGPDLRSSEGDKQAEDNAQWRQHSGGDGLECTRSFAFREDHDERVNCCR